MTSNCKLVELPELVQYNICTYLTSPFDLLHFGNTCTKLRKVSSSRSLWWSIALNWCDGVWVSIPKDLSETHPREWLWQVISKFITRPSGTHLKCEFPGSETWQRVESLKFRFLFGVLCKIYEEECIHPDVTIETTWYDIGLYRRINPSIKFEQENSDVPEDVILKLASLGQGSEHDFRIRKQPHNDPKCYVKRVKTDEKNWMAELFPSGPREFSCSLFQGGDGEKTVFNGLAVCINIVLRDIVKFSYKSFTNCNSNLSRVYRNIKNFCDGIIWIMEVLVHHFNKTIESMSLKDATLYAIKENYFSTKYFQEVLDEWVFCVSFKEVLQRLSDFLNNIKDIDSVVDKVHSKLKRAMFDEMNKVLFPLEFNNGHVTKMNLTDDDFTEEDDSHLGMASAAFISADGVLVTWHHTEKMQA